MDIPEPKFRPMFSVSNKALPKTVKNNIVSFVDKTDRVNFHLIVTEPSITMGLIGFTTSSKCLQIQTSMIICKRQSKELLHRQSI